MTTRYQRGKQNRKSKDRQYNDHKISCCHCIVCPSIYDSGYLFGILWSLYCMSFDLRFWLPLWYLVVIVLSVLRFTVLDTPLASCGHCIVCPSICDSGYPFGILWSLYCLSFDLRFWLPLWYLVVIVLSVLRFTILFTPLVNRWTDNTMTTRCQRGIQNRKSKDRQYNDYKIPKR
jgi:hypothetical protein